MCDDKNIHVFGSLEIFLLHGGNWVVPIMIFVLCSWVETWILSHNHLLPPREWHRWMFVKTLLKSREVVYDKQQLVPSEKVAMLLITSRYKTAKPLQ